MPCFLVSCDYQLISAQISFGTIFWPAVSEYLDELIEVLIQKEAPFVRDKLLFHKIFL